MKPSAKPSARSCSTRRSIIQFGGLALAFGAARIAQAQRPPTSPPMTTTGAVSGKKITVEYFAPSMRGRKIFGALVPYGEVWCPGANWATTINSPDAGLKIDKMNLAAGSYAIWMVTGPEKWDVIINSDPRAFHLSHDPGKDLGRFALTLKKLDTPVEQLRFEIRPSSGNDATIAMLWETTEASFPFSIVPK